MRVLVVDDEALVRSELVYALGKVAPDADVSEAGDALEALQMLSKAPYDVVFLDINLPNLGGIEASGVIAKLEHAPQIVFVTAYQEHAVDAFELGAVDYVVKPVSEARLARTVQRLRTALNNGVAGHRNGSAAPAPGSQPARVALEDGERTRLVRLAEIRYVQANGHVVTARLLDAELRWKGSLSDAAARLEPAGFLRVHRAYLVNPERVVEVEPFFNGAYLLRVDDKARSEVPVSRSYLPAVRKALGL
ncbi:MAG TPA: LytTR family DNA-binding domain-containing protein [Candidatus Baltobacteraceae bacterium]|nr:LytTR family DNA-binding domain-containing protein [Candidatus Baltobacteraceae bacterium]